MKQKRSLTVSSFFSSLFDPLGLLTPFQLSFREFIRDLHLSKINWDEPLNQSFILRAEKLAKQMDDLKRVHLPRVGTYVLYPPQTGLFEFCLK